MLGVAQNPRNRTRHQHRRRRRRRRPDRSALQSHPRQILNAGAAERSGRRGGGADRVQPADADGGPNGFHGRGGGGDTQ